ncbi:hypothetical protein BLNAU_8754 [Blattamonas nauphoetae]|uniref:Uncharacterized protein n=1 Tax=Blattamonas nauphoetae TaxID=2049346 RepID=A0ABQ9XXI2_9EUKA|nr:hypothetical protein BLNAU_8754 [Blattamonas nauphoetae]
MKPPRPFNSLQQIPFSHHITRGINSLSTPIFHNHIFILHNNKFSLVGSSVSNHHNSNFHSHSPILRCHRIFIPILMLLYIKPILNILSYLSSINLSKFSTRHTLFEPSTNLKSQNLKQISQRSLIGSRTLIFSQLQPMHLLWTRMVTQSTTPPKQHSI